MHNPNDIYSVPSKDRFKDEDPTESSRSERTVEITSFRSQRMVDLPLASPDENNEAKEDKPIPIDSLPRRRRRCAFFAIAAVVVGAAVAGCIVVVWFLKSKDSQQEVVAPNQQGHASWVPSDPKPVGCSRDSFQCPDGSFVGRDIANRCGFYPCPVYYPEHEDVVETSRCSSEVLICTDLSTVVRTGPNCEFAECPKGTCPVDTKTCDDGSLAGREPLHGCEFAACPNSELPPAPQQQPTIPRPQQSQQIFTLSPHQPRPQQQETIPRPQQSQQVFTPPPAESSSGFAEVPPQGSSSGSGSAQVCPRDAKMCTDTTTVTRKGPNCEFEECPPGACRVESKLCPDGTSVGLDPNNNCEFHACPPLAQGQCPEGINPREIKLCPNFTTVTRSGPNCEFAPCT